MAVVKQATAVASENGATIELTTDAQAAVDGAAGIYTDVWTSMGWESETQQRRLAFASYQVNDRMMQQARPDALFMHCLPALRGEEVSDSVNESTQSAVFDQAENRLHAQTALLLMLLAP